MQNCGIAFARIQNAATVRCVCIVTLLSRYNRERAAIARFILMRKIAHISIASFIAACRLILLMGQIAIPENYQVLLTSFTAQCVA